MKKITTTLAAVAMTIALHAQTSLPTSWSFTTATFPNGWTASGNAYYTGSGNTPPACKFDNTGDWVQIWFSGSPGTLTYYIAGNSFAGGNFDVQESVNGTTWTTLHAFDASNLPSATYSQFTDNPNSASRYIRFYYTNKVTGNVGVDDVNIGAPAAGPQQEINVKDGSTPVISGGTIYKASPVSTNTPFTLTVENQGLTNTLNISNVAVSGPNAGDFNVSSFPSTVAATSSGSINVDFTPAASGTRMATLTITSDDADEGSYIVNIYGVGGQYATSPTAQPTALTFTNVKSYRFNASFTAATPAPDGYIVLRHDGSAVTDVPVDGNAYTTGDMVGASKVVYSGTATAFVPHTIIANTAYHFAVFSYNGPGVFRKYLAASPLTGTVTTAGSMQPSTYYNGINTGSASFVTDLTNLIATHQVQFYSNYGGSMVSNFFARDTTGDQRVVTCRYSGDQFVYTEPFAWGYMSREHSYCHSWMPSYPSTSGDEYNDYFNLYPVNQNDANAIRSNYPLGEVVNATYTFMSCKYGQDLNGHTVFEPRDEQKGNSARSIFYMATCYNTATVNWGLPNPISASIAYGQDQNVLKRWSYQDPPDNEEIARNDYIDSLQHNRNPFIDSLQYACFIDFSNMTKINGPMLPCNTVGIHEQKKDISNLSLWPNPADGSATLYFASDRNQRITLRVFDFSGRVVYQQNSEITKGNNALALQLGQLSAGTYTVQVQHADGVSTEKLVVQ